MTVNVLADRHHAGLYRSLQLLAARLGWNLYTPHGREWWDEGYWNFGRNTYGDDRLARQFLEPAGSFVGAFHRSDDEEFPGRHVWGVTLATAREMPWHAVLATVPDNQEGFWRFSHEQSARFAVQCGNTGQEIDWSLDPIVLNSSEMPLLGRGVQMHQELDPAFRFRDPIYADLPYLPDRHVVRSFVHLMNETHAFPLWNGLRDGLRDFTFQRYGHAPGEYDPTYVTNAKPIERIAQLMWLAGWGFHDKPVGDGFGHVIHGWAATGRPLIGHASHYRGKLGAVFWRDLETCIDLDRHPVPEAVELIQEITASPERHREMCRAIRAEYDRIDYAAEAAAIEGLLQ